MFQSISCSDHCGPLSKGESGDLWAAQTGRIVAVELLRVFLDRFAFLFVLLPSDYIERLTFSSSCQQPDGGIRILAGSTVVFLRRPLSYVLSFYPQKLLIYTLKTLSQKSS